MALPLTCFTALLLAQATPERPSDVAWQAIRAIERDSVPTYRSAWERDLARNPADRRAMLGLASLDRMLYDSAARGRYSRLLDQAPSGDPYTPYAWIGLGWFDFWRVGFDTPASSSSMALPPGGRVVIRWPRRRPSRFWAGSTPG